MNRPAASQYLTASLAYGYAGAGLVADVARGS